MPKTTWWTCAEHFLASLGERLARNNFESCVSAVYFQQHAEEWQSTRRQQVLFALPLTRATQTQRGSHEVCGSVQGIRKIRIERFWHDSCTRHLFSNIQGSKTRA